MLDHRDWGCLAKLLRNFFTESSGPLYWGGQLSSCLRWGLLKWVSCVKELEIQNSIQSISPKEQHQEEGGWTLTQQVAGQSDISWGQRYKVSFCFQRIHKDTKQKINSCSFLWNGPDLGWLPLSGFLNHAHTMLSQWAEAPASWPRQPLTREEL